jgi:hypothetical protein
VIYFITARDIGRVKIGYSAAPHKRFSKVQSDSPVPLKLERVCAGCESAEARLHMLFSEHRLGGEWFTLAPEIEAHMEALEQPIAPRTISKIALAGPLGNWIAHNGHTVESFADLIGTSKATISRVCNGKNEPSAKLLRDIVRATGGAVTADAMLFPNGLEADLAKALAA